MSDQQPKSKPKTYRPSQLIDEGEALAQRAWEARERGIVHGPAVPGFPILAKEICGSIPPGLTVLLGSPGSGKSALAGQIADHSGVPTLIATFEMSPLELLRRSASRINNTHTSKYRDGTLTPDEWRREITKAAAALPHLAYLDGTRDDVSATDLFRELALLRHDLGDPEHALLVVDSVSAWARSTQGTAPNENEAVTLRLRELQQLASKGGRLEPPCGISVFAIGEQNRANQGSGRQESGAGSRVFEYGAEVLMTLKKPKKPGTGEDEEDDEAEKSIVDRDLILAKNRLGCPGKRIRLRFEGGKMQFSERSKDEAEAEAVRDITARVMGRNGKLAHSAKIHNGKTAT